MALKDNSFMRRLVGTNKERYLFLMLLKAIFNTNEPVINMLLESNELMIDGVTFQQIVTQDIGCPSTEGSSVDTVNAISNRDDGIEVVIFGFR